VTQITKRPKLAAPLPQNGAYFQQKNRLIFSNRTHSTNNCNSFIAPAAHHPLPKPPRPLPAATDEPSPLTLGPADPLRYQLH
jgi:hypothetical protein